MKRYPLYSEGLEHDSCGVGAVVNLNGQAEHRVVCDALTIVERLAHRAGCDGLDALGPETRPVLAKLRAMIAAA